MTLYTIFTTANPFQRQNVNLDGVEFNLALAYNQREERWYLSIYDDENVLLIAGLKLQANWGILWRHRYNTKLPAGEIVAIDTRSKEAEPPTLLELGEGKRCALVYLDASEVAASKAGEPVSIVSIYVAVRVTPLGGYPGDSAFASALAAACGTLGARFATSDVLTLASAIAGATVTGLSIGTTPQPSGPVTIIVNTITVGANQRPAFSVNVASV